MKNHNIHTVQRFLLLAVCVYATSSVNAQSITPQLLNQLRSNYQESPAERALRNAIGSNDLRTLALNQQNLQAMDTHFTYEVKSKGITDQQRSGRCWLFTGLNVLRARAIRDFDLGEFQFSQSYIFFYDQLEKSNLFLQSIIDTRRSPMDDRTVDWLFHNPLSDGGTFSGVADLVTKYGLVPADVMPETYSANHTARMSDLLRQKLRQFGLELRDMSEKSASEKQLLKRKEEMLGVIYKMLALNLGQPPTEFTWTMRNSKGEVVSSEQYTPLTFAHKLAADPVLTDYVMVMNDPSHDYYKVYEIEFDRHTYDGQNWLYLNLPVEDIKQLAVSSLKDTAAMYFSCDVNKHLNSERGLLDMNNYDYASIMGTDFPMDKRQRVITFASGSSHAMTLMAVDLDGDGKPVKWMVENSWGAKSGYKGHLIMTDQWFDEYMFRLVVARKYVPENLLALMKQKPVKLPAWDPMFSMDE